MPPSALFPQTQLSRGGKPSNKVVNMLFFNLQTRRLAQPRVGVVTCERPTDVHLKKDVKSVINIYALLSDDVATVLTTLIQTYCKDKFAKILV